MIKIDAELNDIDRELLNEVPQLVECDSSDVLFVDIETTGLSPKTSDIYLIGTAFFEGGNFKIRQFFAESAMEEKEILSAFSEFVNGYKTLVHFNGDKFDLPFMDAKYKKYDMINPLEALSSYDIYKKVKPYKLQLGLSDCKQKTIELFLGIEREDKYSGGKLIPVYEDYKKTKSREALELLLLHNADDVRGLFRILPVLKYHEFFSLFKNMPKVSVKTDEPVDDSSFDNNLPVRASKVQANYYTDIDGSRKQEVFMKLKLPFELPVPLSGNVSSCFFKTDKNEATLRVPLYETELKYFYANYKDYYYLPREDMAIHKSLATFVDKNYREKAKPENCYTKKEGQYLVEWDLVFAPFFKRDYEDKSFFFDLTENMKKSRFAMSLYASHVIAHILDN
ncbi:MAG: ribonuclease H-like domain-containing protein [Butyrivibrio sp.]|nr:ribonuclease H-like domain-containing protein [Butyrivibrio sp.]